MRELPELGPEFEIVVDRKAALDEMLVRVQYGPQMARRLEGLSPEERERALSELGDRTANELRRAIGIRSPRR